MNVYMAFLAGCLITAVGYEWYRIHRVHRDTGLPIRWMGPRRARRELEATIALVRSGAMDYAEGTAQFHADVGTAVVLWRIPNVPYRIEEAALEWLADELDRRTPELRESLPPGTVILNTHRAQLQQLRAKIRRR